jgi:tetratricopeptide (TPR) repeat protein
MTMQRIVLLVLLMLAIPAVAQEWPKPTEEGKKALDDLINRCAATQGARSRWVLLGFGAIHLMEIDDIKLRAAVEADKTTLTPALRDALVARWAEPNEDQEPVIIALLRAMGDVADDGRALAFATFFEARREETNEPTASIRLFTEAARRFADTAEHDWQAACHNYIAVVYISQSEFAKALESFQEALNIDRAVYGEQHPKIASRYNNIAFIYYKQGEYARALEGFEKAMEIDRAIYSERHPNVATCYSNIAAVYAEQGQYIRSLEGYLKALDIRHEVYGDRHPEVAITYEHIAEVYHSKGDYTRALENYRKSLSIWRAMYGERHPDIAACYTGIGVVYADQGQYTRALEDHQKALDILRAMYGERHPDVATIYSNIAYVYSRQGECAKAIEIFEKALETWRSVYGERHPDVALAYINLADVYASQGEYDRALEDNQKALEIWRAMYGERHPQVAACHNNLAGIYASQGEYDRALEGYQKALDIVRAVYGEGRPRVAVAYSNVASIYASQGEYDRALEGYQKALDVLRAVYGERHPDVASCYNNIAEAYSSKGEHAKAMEDHQKALEIRRAVYGERHPDVAESCLNIAGVHADQGEYAEAITGYQEALDILRAVYGEQHPHVALGYYDLAFAYANQGEYTKAMGALDRALDALRVEAGPIASSPDAVRASSRLRPLPLTVQVLEVRGKAKEQSLGPDPVAILRDCLHDYQAAADVLEQVRQRVLATDPSKMHLDEESSELFPRTIGVAVRLAEADGTPADRHAALAAAERGAARVFLEGLGRARATVVGRVDPGIRAEEASGLARICELDGRIDRVLAQPFEERDSAAVRRLFDERQQAEERLQALITRMEHDYPQYTALKYPKVCTAEEARDCLGADEVGLLYVLGTKASYLIVLAKEDDPETAGITIHKLAPAEEIAERVARLTRPATLEDSDSVREQGAELYRMLLAPAAEAIRGKNLVIVPGGALGFLPFALLVEPAEGPQKGGDRFLVEGHRIRYAPSLTALHVVRLWERTRGAPERPLWALGDPVYGGSDSRRTAQTVLSPDTRYAVAKRRDGDPGAGFPRLEGSGEEVQRLATLMGATPEEVLVGPAATEAAVKRLSAADVLARYRYVHFATHGILGLGDATQPALVLSLAGEQHGEDGFLQLDEVTGLRLNADLVVLSACHTGQGKLHNAEGISGLARAFLSAGSRGVLCSLWPVDDRETGELMVDLYAGLKAGQPAAEALRDAQLKRIQAGQPPLDWAPFILIGR